MCCVFERWMTSLPLDVLCQYARPLVLKIWRTTTTTDGRGRGWDGGCTGSDCYLVRFEYVFQFLFPQNNLIFYIIQYDEIAQKFSTAVIKLGSLFSGFCNPCFGGISCAKKARPSVFKAQTFCNSCLGIIRYD